MNSNPKNAHELAEKGVDAAEKGEKAKSDALIDRAEQLDPQALDTVAQETEERRQTP
jgi:hypothetical protein